MIKQITKWLVKYNAISVQDVPLYTYALESLFLSVLPIILTLFIGLLLNLTFEGFVMILPFSIIRKFSGGYHSKTKKICFLFSIGLLLLCFCLIKYMTNYAFMDMAILLSIILLITYSPIDSESRRLDPQEKQNFKRIASILSILFGFVYSLLRIFAFNDLSVCLGTGVLLTSVLQIPCILSYYMNKIKKK